MEVNIKNYQVKT